RAAASARAAGRPPTVRGLGVAVLHGAILDPILGVGPGELEFTHEDSEAFEAVASGRATAAFLLNPPSVAAVRAVCLAGELMPEKSTYFYPKLASGLVFDLIDGDRWVRPPGGGGGGRGHEPPARRSGSRASSPGRAGAARARGRCPRR